MAINESSMLNKISPALDSALSKVHCEVWFGVSIPFIVNAFVPLGYDDDVMFRPAFVNWISFDKSESIDDVLISAVPLASNLTCNSCKLPAIVNAVGGKIEIIVDGGVRRGTHVLKALAAGATACSFGKGFLFALGAGGQKGVEMILQRMRDEIRRDMILMGCKNIKELNPSKIVFR